MPWSMRPVWCEVSLESAKRDDPFSAPVSKKSSRNEAGRGDGFRMGDCCCSLDNSDDVCGSIVFCDCENEEDESKVCVFSVG